eukprot:Pgem_evm1s1473
MQHLELIVCSLRTWIRVLNYSLFTQRRFILRRFFRRLVPYSTVSCSTFALTLSVVVSVFVSFRCCETMVS